MVNLDLIGNTIKNIRTSKNLTLKQLSQQTGISIGYLSNLERNTCSPTLEYIQKICESLNITITELLSEANDNKILVTRSERSTVFDDVSQLKYETVNHGDTILKSIFLTIAPNTTYNTTEWKHDRDEIGIIIKGQMEIILEGNSYTVSEGDSIYIPRGKNHCYINHSSDECLSYWVYKNNTID